MLVCFNFSFVDERASFIKRPKYKWSCNIGVYVARKIGGVNVIYDQISQADMNVSVTLEGLGKETFLESLVDWSKEPNYKKCQLENPLPVNSKIMN